MFLWGHLIRGSGAIFVQRRQEHGDSADNTDVFASVAEGLKEGGLVGIAPEGTSRMRSYVTPLKSGVAHFALQAVASEVKKGNLDFKVRVLPCGLTYLHREKWRSSVLVGDSRLLPR